MMRHVKRFAGLMLLLFFLSACASMQSLTKQEAFPKMYEDHPLTILVLPPINESTAADAKEYYSTTIAEPLSLAGYYVFPIEVVSEIFKQEGLYDTESMADMPAGKFKEYFGADAVLYTRIRKWDTAYYVIGGHMTVSVDFLLRSTATEETLWKYNGTIVVDTTGDSGNAPGLAGLLVQAVGTAVKTASTDYVPLAKQANRIALVTIPYGKYNPAYDQDRDLRVVSRGKLEEEQKD